MFLRKAGNLRDDIYCLMTNSISLTDRMRSILFDTACSMLGKGVEKRRIYDDEIEGVVSTSFESQTLTGISGIEFHARVETELGSGKVKYLVRQIDAKARSEGEWMGFSSVDDLMQEVNSPPSRRNYACN